MNRKMHVRQLRDFGSPGTLFLDIPQSRTCLFPFLLITFLRWGRGGCALWLMTLDISGVFSRY